MKRPFAAFTLLFCCLAIISDHASMVRAAGDNHGAIAYSDSTGKCGYSYDFNSRRAAENTAVEECGKSDCEVVVWFQNNCGALAEGESAIGYAYGPNKADAQQLALEKCSEETTNCEVICWACNSH